MSQFAADRGKTAAQAAHALAQVEKWMDIIRDINRMHLICATCGAPYKIKASDEASADEKCFVCGTALRTS